MPSTSSAARRTPCAAASRRARSAAATPRVRRRRRRRTRARRVCAVALSRSSILPSGGRPPVSSAVLRSARSPSQSTTRSMSQTLSGSSKSSLRSISSPSMVFEPALAASCTSQTSSALASLETSATSRVFEPSKSPQADWRKRSRTPSKRCRTFCGSFKQAQDRGQAQDDVALQAGRGLEALAALVEVARGGNVDVPLAEDAAHEGRDGGDLDLDQEQVGEGIVVEARELQRGDVVGGLEDRRGRLELRAGAAAVEDPDLAAVGDDVVGDAVAVEVARLEGGGGIDDQRVARAHVGLLGAVAEDREVDRDVGLRGEGAVLALQVVAAPIAVDDEQVGALVAVDVARRERGNRERAREHVGERLVRARVRALEIDGDGGGLAEGGPARGRACRSRDRCRR